MFTDLNQQKLIIYNFEVTILKENQCVQKYVYFLKTPGKLFILIYFYLFSCLLVLTHSLAPGLYPSSEPVS